MNAIKNTKPIALERMQFEQFLFKNY